MTYTVARCLAIQDPPSKSVKLTNAGPPPSELIITDVTADEWVLFNAAYGSTVTVTLDAAGKRTVSRP